MNEASDYKEVPQNLLTETLGRSANAAVDPMLCGYQRLMERLQIPRKGVIHLGGHLGQELPMYAALGFRNVVIVEPLPREYAELQRRVSLFNATCGALAEFLGEAPTRAHAVRCAVSERSGSSTFYRTKETSLSSLAKPRPESFSNQWQAFDGPQPWYRRPFAWFKNRSAVRYEEIPVISTTLDELVTTLPHGWTASDFSYLRMNIQGSELKALSGGEAVLRHLSLIDLETNIEQRYEGAPSRRDFDEFLNARGFVAIFGYRVGPMGNLVYMRRNAAHA